LKSTPSCDCCLLYATFLLISEFNTRNGGKALYHDVVWLSADYTALYVTKRSLSKRHLPAWLWRVMLQWPCSLCVLFSWYQCSESSLFTYTLS
jgi:hypothetical protein